MHAYLIVGQRKVDREKAVSATRAQLRTDEISVIRLTGGERSIGIADVREFQKRIYLAPRTGTVTLGLIEDAHTLTPAAQHALLKTLEEPPKSTRIILETERSTSLLPTIVSRCQVCDLGFADRDPRDLITTLSTLNSMLAVSPGERFAILETGIHSRVEAITWVETGLSACYRGVQERSRQGVRATPFTVLIPHSGKISQALETARSQLAANCNWRLVLDIVALSIAWTSHEAVVYNK